MILFVTFHARKVTNEELHVKQLQHKYSINNADKATMIFLDDISLV